MELTDFTDGDDLQALFMCAGPTAGTVVTLIEDPPAAVCEGGRERERGEKNTRHIRKSIPFWLFPVQ